MGIPWSNVAYNFGKIYSSIICSYDYYPTCVCVVHIFTLDKQHSLHHNSSSSIQEQT